MSARPQLTTIDGEAAPQFGIVFDDHFGRRRDWDGPFKTEKKALAALGERIDLDDEEARESSKVVVWNARLVQLAKAMAKHSIHPNGDYGFEDLLEILSGEEECGRYGVIRSDETYTIIEEFARLA